MSIDYRNTNLNLLNAKQYTYIADFVNILAMFEYIPLIDKPTRCTDRGTATLIDNIFAKNLDNIFNGGIVLADISDHYLIFSNLQPKTYKETKILLHKRNFSNKNRNSFLHDMAKHEWQSLYEYKDTQAAYSCLHETIKIYFEKNFPTKRVKNTYKDRLPWLTEELKLDIKTKNVLYLRFKKHPTQINYDKYKLYRNILNKRLVSIKRSYYNHLLLVNKSNMKKYWAVIKELINNKHKIPYPSHFVYQNNQVTSETEIANKFNDFFVKIGSNLASVIPKPVQNTTLSGNYPHSFFLEPTTHKEIELTIARLNVAAPGWDEISHSLLLSISKYLIEPLVHIINLSFLEGIVPFEVKKAKVLPLYKSGDPHEFSNYRPISILSIISKIFEKLIYSRLTKFLNKHDILYKYQFGFRESHSTELALNSLNSFISSAFENKQFALGIFLDFSKAFDTVNFKILLSKLAHYGIRGTPLKWLENYLLNRNQHVIFNDSVSKNEVIKTGVPQGSILGPLLFLIYVNDLPLMSKTFHTIMYADDSTILFKGPSAGDLIITANQELKSVVNWLSQNKLSLNIKKCNYIIFSRKGTHADTHMKLKLNQNEITQLDQIKFLGYIVDHKLSWKPQIQYISSKISKSLAILQKLIKTINISNLQNLYYSFIYPYLINGITVWGSAGATALNPVIKLQKRLVRILSSSPRYEHTAPLFKKLKFLPLEYLFKYAMLIFMFKYKNNMLPQIYKECFTTNKRYKSKETRQSSLYYIPRFRTNYLERNILVQGPILANQYKELFSEQCSVGTFKLRVKNILLSELT